MSKNPQAVALGKKRWENIPLEERRRASQILHEAKARKKAKKAKKPEKKLSTD